MRSSSFWLVLFLSLISLLPLFCVGEAEAADQAAARLEIALDLGELQPVTRTIVLSRGEISAKFSCGLPESSLFKVSTDFASSDFILSAVSREGRASLWDGWAGGAENIHVKAIRLAVLDAEDASIDRKPRAAAPPVDSLFPSKVPPQRGFDFLSGESKTDDESQASSPTEQANVNVENAGGVDQATVSRLGQDSDQPGQQDSNSGEVLPPLQSRRGPSFRLGEEGFSRKPNVDGQEVFGQSDESRAQGLESRTAAGMSWNKNDMGPGQPSDALGQFVQPREREFPLSRKRSRRSPVSDPIKSGRTYGSRSWRPSRDGPVSAAGPQGSMIEQLAVTQTLPEVLGQAVADASQTANSDSNPTVLGPTEADAQQESLSDAVGGVEDSSLPTNGILEGTSGVGEVSVDTTDVVVDSSSSVAELVRRKLQGDEEQQNDDPSDASEPSTPMGVPVDDSLTGTLDPTSTYSSDIVSVYTDPLLDDIALSSIGQELQGLKVVYVCKKPGNARMRIEIEVESNGTSTIRCISWIKECSLSWGNLMINEASTSLPVVRNGVVVEGWYQTYAEKGGSQQLPRPAFLIGTSSGSVRLANASVASDSSDMAVSLKGWVPDSMMAEAMGILEVSNEASYRLDVGYTCSSNDNPQQPTRVAMNIVNEQDGVSPLLLEWMAICKMNPKELNFTVKAFSDCKSEIAPRIAYSEGEVQEEFTTSAASPFTVPASADCSSFAISVPSGQGVPRIEQSPSIAYDRKILWVKKSRPDVEEQDDQFLVTISYVCLAEGSTAVQMTVHLEEAEAVDISWQKVCLQPQTRRGYAFTASSAVGLLGVVFVSIGLCCWTPCGRAAAKMLRKKERYRPLEEPSQFQMSERRPMAIR